MNREKLGFPLKISGIINCNIPHSTWFGYKKEGDCRSCEKENTVVSLYVNGWNENMLCLECANDVRLDDE